MDFESKLQADNSDLTTKCASLPQVLRQFGSFTIEILNDPVRGQELLAQADDVERKRQHKVQRLKHIAQTSLFDDDTGVVMLSCDADSLGVIVTVNPALCSIFGRAQSELLGKSVSMLIPPPFASLHSGWITSFVNGRSSSRVLERTSRMFALHKNGTIFPILLTVKQVSGGLAQSRFLGMVVAEHVPSSEHYMLVDELTRVVHRCSAGVYPLLGLSQDEVESGTAKLDTCLPDMRLADLMLEDDSGNTDGSLEKEAQVPHPRLGQQGAALSVSARRISTNIHTCILLRVKSSGVADSACSASGAVVTGKLRQIAADRAAGMFTVREEDEQEESRTDQLIDGTKLAVLVTDDSKECTVPDVLLDHDQGGQESAAAALQSSSSVRARRVHRRHPSTEGPDDGKSQHAVSIQGGQSNASSHRSKICFIIQERHVYYS